ncbi:MAG TPA: hydroxyacid dehydrogenase [Candidatus Anaerostipes excrementavium]|uniref:Hydroxyacid dehydrogenase n=1 Tax=Candidatus Anaerostipes excrementavium TaxID=2838463 RepID=A0A9D2BAX7_9FIRM|nr:2-hydroxyacid dehydrogenase [uncultured Anaerostipes sp.]HIX68684.1 hydroxyacid dehydrogenase [Candidatus Anaerostipes excrementavium]
MKIVLLEELGVPKDKIDKQAEKLTNMGHELITYTKNTDPKIQVERTKDADVIMLANMPLSKEVVEEAKHLKFIDVAFTGVDHIPMEEAKARNIAVSNASGYATQAVAELCISFMIQLLRNIEQTQKRCREGGTKDGWIGSLLCGKTVGIVGAGAIGKKTAKLCKAFGCRVIAYSRSKVEDSVIDRQVPLDELLKEADIVSLHCPLTKETKGLIGKEQLEFMKKEAILINTARGPVVDSKALADALTEGKIAGAACDVFETEPPLDTDHPLLHTPNTIVTPHIAFASKESMEQRAEIVFDNLYSWMEGKQKNKM